MKIRLTLLAIFINLSFSGYVQTITQWRGPARDGIYPEKDLLKSRPTEGPRQLWMIDRLGNGFSSPVITADKIYVPGEIDSTGYLYAFDKSGMFLWKTAAGDEWNQNFPGPRSTPTVVDDLVYYCTSKGDVVCLDAETGRKQWSVSMVKDLHGKITRFGYAESLLVDGNRIFCSPGGRDTNIIALNRFTGQMVWKSKAMGDSAAFCSPMLIHLPARKILVTFMIHHLVGIDAGTGELLWSHKQDRPNDIHCNTPVYENGFIYYDNRGGNGTVKLELSPDGLTIKEIWRNFKSGNIQGGFIKTGNYLYGSRYRPARFESQDAGTGEITDSLKFGCGSTIYADGMLYCYNDQGMVGLISPGQGKPVLVSSFHITGGTLEHFAHPVICDGILYIRHGKALMAYDIRKK